MKNNKIIFIIIFLLFFGIPSSGEEFNFKSGGFVQIEAPAYKNLDYKSFNVEDKYKEDLIKSINPNKIVDLMGESITLTHAYMKLSNLFIGNDSGLMHLAAAANIHTIGLFGPTNHILYAPYGKKCFIIRTKETYEEFNLINIDKFKTYMTSIEVDHIIKVIEDKKLL